MRTSGIEQGALLFARRGLPLLAREQPAAQVVRSLVTEYRDFLRRLPDEQDPARH